MAIQYRIISKSCKGHDFTNIDSCRIISSVILVKILNIITTDICIRTFKPRKVKGAFWICSLVLVALFAVPYIPFANGISLNSLYEFVCIACIFPALVWLGHAAQQAVSQARQTVSLETFHIRSTLCTIQ